MDKVFKYSSNKRTFAECPYGEFNKLMFDTALGEAKVGTEEANNKIREIMFNVLEISPESNRKQIRRAIRNHKNEIFEVIEDLVPNLLKTGWQDNPFFKDYVEYKSGADGDLNVWYVEDDTILSVFEVAGNHHDIIRQRLGEGSEFAVKTSWYAVKIYAEFEHFMTGRVDWAGFIQKVYKAFDQQVNTLIYKAFMEAAEKVQPTSQFTKTIQLDAANEATILELAEDVATATGEEAVIVGTKVALAKLSKITDVSWYSGAMKDERNTLGRLGVWNGIRLVEIPQAFEPGDTTKKLVDNNRLLVLPAGDNKFIKMYDEGDPIVTENTDQATNMDMTVEYEYQQKMGVAVVINKKFGVIKITG